MWVLSTKSLSTQCANCGGVSQQVRRVDFGPDLHRFDLYTFESTDSTCYGSSTAKKSRAEYGRYGTPNEKSVEAKLGCS